MLDQKRLDKGKYCKLLRYSPTPKFTEFSFEFLRRGEFLSGLILKKGKNEDN